MLIDNISNGEAAELLYWSEWQLPAVAGAQSGGLAAAAATSRGLCYVGAGTWNYNDLAGWTAKHLAKAQLVRDDRALEPYRAQLDAYWRGERTDFTFPLDIHGTEFQRRIWQALASIPYGQTCSYGQIAARAGKPEAARAAGAAIGANPLLIAVPCHRVIGKNGAMTGYRGGLPLKEQLLALERRLR